ncbi:sugar ABC transporter substrate-binding protein [Actinopolymorpha sp. B11F2]|uniref:ABC transporter substrate-binding protein n=1 Tax=Actinopolymorpha sp. B11F2 TaxID=3160862 RepID=UPI0032E52BDC
MSTGAAVGVGALAAGPVTAACSPFGSTVDEGGKSEGGGGSLRFITPADLGLERDLYKGFLREFEEANSGSKVTVTFEAWDDYMTKLPTLLAGGAAPDLIHQHMSIVQDYGHRGALLDLAPLMERDGIDRSAFVPSLLDAFSEGDKVYGIPKDSAAWGVYYNKDKFDEAGVPYPADDWTMEDLRETARALTRDDQGRSPDDAGFNPKKIKQYGLNWMEPLPTFSENARAFVLGLGGDWYDEDYTTTLIDEAPALEQFELFRAMRCDDRSTPSPALDLGQGDPFRAQLTAMTVGHHSTDFFLREESVEFSWGVTFIPGGPGGQFVAVGCSGWAIAAGAKNKEGAWELLKHLTSEPVQRSFAEQKRWAPSIQNAMGALIREDSTDGFVKVHVDPLRERSDRTVITMKFPANQSRIQEAYAGNFDSIYTTCKSDDIEGAARATKEQVDSILAEG